MGPNLLYLVWYGLQHEIPQVAVFCAKVETALSDVYLVFVLIKFKCLSAISKSALLSC